MTDVSNRICPECGDALEATKRIVAVFCSRRCAGRRLRRENRARYRSYGRSQYAAHAEERRAASRAYGALHAEERRKYARDRYHADPEAARRRCREWREAHADVAYENARRNYLKHAEKRRAAARSYWQRNPVVRVGDERIRPTHLPPELQGVALLIRETRREIRNRRAHQ